MTARLSALRAPPANLEAEQALLGALLVNNRAADRVADTLRREHFADAVHGRIYADVMRMIEAGRLVTATTLKAELEHAAALEEVGGAAYLAGLVAAHVGVVNVGEYARVIRETWVRRQLVEAGEGIVNAAFDPEGVDAPAQIEQAEAALFALADAGAGQRRTVTIADAAALAIDAAEAAARRGDGLVGVTTGYAALDRMTAGWMPGEMVIIGARPGMGKTALSLGFAMRAAAAGKRVLFVSLEMLAHQIASRAVAALANVQLTALISGRVLEEERPPRSLDQAEWDRIAAAQARLPGLPLMIDDAAKADVAAIRSLARRVARQGGLDLLIVDYLGLVRASASAERMHNRTHEVSQISRDLKATAKELGVPLLVLAQLNRANETREDKRPGLADLRDSGSIEQDADRVMFLHREHYYLLKLPPKRGWNEADDKFYAREEAWHRAVEAERGRADLYIAKNRQGPAGNVRLRFADELTWFTDESEHDGTTRPDALGPQGRMA